MSVNVMPTVGQKDQGVEQFALPGQLAQGFLGPVVALRQHQSWYTDSGPFRLLGTLGSLWRQWQLCSRHQVFLLRALGRMWPRTFERSFGMDHAGRTRSRKVSFQFHGCPGGLRRMCGGSYRVLSLVISGWNDGFVQRHRTSETCLSLLPCRWWFDILLVLYGREPHWRSIVSKGPYSYKVIRKEFLQGIFGDFPSNLQFDRCSLLMEHFKLHLISATMIKRKKKVKITVKKIKIKIKTYTLRIRPIIKTFPLGFTRYRNFICHSSGGSWYCTCRCTRGPSSKHSKPSFIPRRPRHWVFANFRHWFSRPLLFLEEAGYYWGRHRGIEEVKLSLPVVVRAVMNFLCMYEVKVHDFFFVN